MYDEYRMQCVFISFGRRWCFFN